MILLCSNAMTFIHFKVFKSFFSSLIEWLTLKDLCFCWGRITGWPFLIKLISSGFGNTNLLKFFVWLKQATSNDHPLNDYFSFSRSLIFFLCPSLAFPLTLPPPLSTSIVMKLSRTEISLFHGDERGRKRGFLIALNRSLITLRSVLLSLRTIYGA